MNEAKLGETLIKLGAINALHLAKAAQQQKKDGGSLSAALVAINAITSEELARIAATLLKLPFVSLRRVSIPAEMVRLLSADVANKCQAIVLKVEGKNFYVGMTQPTNIDMVDNLRFRLSGNVVPVVISEMEMERALEFYYGKLKNQPLSLPPSTGLTYTAEQFDIRKARAAEAPPPAAKPAQSAPPATPKQPAPAAAIAAPVAAAVVQPAPAAPVTAAPELVKPTPEPVLEEVLELLPESEPAATDSPAGLPSDDDLIKELANFLLSK